MKNNILEYRRRVLSKALKFIQLTGKEKIIDIGCGDGGDCELLSQKVETVTGIDVAPCPNWQKITINNISLSVADVCNLPFADEAFDLIFEKDVLHHVENYNKGSQEILRVTKKGGYIICVEGNRYNPILYFHMTLLKGHDHFSKTFFNKLMNSYGKNVSFVSVESRVYPTNNKMVLKALHRVEDFLEFMPLIGDYLCYNIAVIKKP